MKSAGCPGWQGQLVCWASAGMGPMAGTSTRCFPKGSLCRVPSTLAAASARTHPALAGPSGPGPPKAVFTPGVDAGLATSHAPFSLPNSPTGPNPVHGVSRCCGLSLSTEPADLLRPIMDPSSAHDYAVPRPPRLPLPGLKPQTARRPVNGPQPFTPGPVSSAFVAFTNPASTPGQIPLRGQARQRASLKKSPQPAQRPLLGLGNSTGCEKRLNAPLKMTCRPAL